MRKRPPMTDDELRRAANFELGCAFLLLDLGIIAMFVAAWYQP